MSLCDSCRYQYYVEQLKPCIVRRKDCEFYEPDDFHEESKIDMSDSKKMEDVAKAFQIGLALGFGENHDEMDKVIDEIKKVITPQTKTGYWIIYDVHGHKACKCSECDKDVGYPCNYKYCPYCGIRIIGSKELIEWKKDKGDIERQIYAKFCRDRK